MSEERRALTASFVHGRGGRAEQGASDKRPGLGRSGGGRGNE